MRFFEELKRRNVIRVGIAYVVVAWLLAQVADLALDNFEAPGWVIKTILLLLALGLPLALFFAWAFELTPEGIRKESDVEPGQSITPQTGRKLDFIIIGVLSVALAWFAWDKFASGRDPTAPPAAAVATDAAPAQPVATSKSVAVLPFVAMSNGPDDEYFADGLTEEILNSLAQLPELLVTARTSAFSFKGEDRPVQEIAAALNVEHIVEGSVRRSGDRLRVTSQLVRARDGFHLWSDTYDSTSTDAIAVQENIAEQIALALDIFMDDERRKLIRQAGFRDAQAFIDFQKGFEFYNLAHGDMDLDEGLRQANLYLDRVIERSPEASSRVYVLRADRNVHALQDDVYNNVPMQADYADTIGAGYQDAITDYEAAVRYSRSPEERALYELNLALVSDDWNGIVGRLERVLEDTESPSCAVGNFMQNLALVAGYGDQYLEWVRRALTCDPRYSSAWMNAARAALWSGNREEALRLAEQGSRQAPGSWLSLTLARTLIAEQRLDEAERLIDSRVTEPSDKLAFKALVAAQRSDQAQFDRLLEQHRAEFGTEFHTIALHAWGGHRDEANQLAAAMDAKPYSSLALFTTTMWCACGAPWDLEATPNFAANIAKSGISWPPRSPMDHPLKTWD